MVAKYPSLPFDEWDDLNIFANLLHLLLQSIFQHQNCHPQWNDRLKLPCLIQHKVLTVYPENFQLSQ